MKIKMTKISGGNALRTESVIGSTDDEPVIGVPFVMFAKPIDEKFDVRAISTSPVVAIDGNIITTESGSKYKIENLVESN